MLNRLSTLGVDDGRSPVRDPRGRPRIPVAPTPASATAPGPASSTPAATPSAAARPTATAVTLARCASRSWRLACRRAGRHPGTPRSSVRSTIEPVFPSPKPRRRTSVRKVVPVRSATTSRTCSRSASTSSAGPPSSAWMKSRAPRQHGGSDPEALQPGGVDSGPAEVAPRVGEHRSGVGAPGLIRPPPRDDVGQRPPAVLDRPRRTVSSARAPARAAPTRGAPVAELQEGDAGGAAAIPAEVDPRVASRQAAMSEPCPPAFMPTAPPTDPGTPTAQDRPTIPHRRHGGPTQGAPEPPPADHGPSLVRRHARGRSGKVETREAGAELHDDTVEPGVGHEEVGTPAEHEQGQVPSSSAARTTSRSAGPRPRSGPRPAHPRRTW